LTTGYAPVYAYAEYDGGTPVFQSFTEEPGEGLLVSAAFNYHAELIRNHIAKPLVVKKTIVNREYTAREDFEFALQVKNGSGDESEWQTVLLAAVAGKAGVYRFAGGESGADVLDGFTIRVQADAAEAEIRIEELPTGDYRVVELTQGYAPRYAYLGNAAAATNTENNGLHVDQTSGVDYSVAVTNYVSTGGSGDPPSPPPITPPPTEPPAEPPTDAGGDGGDDDGGATTTPGGKEPSVPPRPTAPGTILVPAGDGVYIEIGEDGTPLGEWRWDDPTDQWIFDEYPPLADMLPQTGFRAAVAETGRSVYPFIILTTLLLLLLVCLPSAADWRARRKSRWY
jgi:hypothetical protein